jgi:hypothetical protein
MAYQSGYINLIGVFFKDLVYNLTGRHRRYVTLSKGGFTSEIHQDWYKPDGFTYAQCMCGHISI